MQSEFFEWSWLLLFVVDHTPVYKPGLMPLRIRDNDWTWLCWKFVLVKCENGSEICWCTWVIILVRKVPWKTLILFFFFTPCYGTCDALIMLFKYKSILNQIEWIFSNLLFAFCVHVSELSNLHQMSKLSENLAASVWTFDFWNHCILYSKCRIQNCMLL